jgi:hypothetical protein
LISVSKGSTTQYETAQLALSYSIWKDHSLNLGPDGSIVKKGTDVAEHDGKLYLALPPGLGIISVPFTSIGFVMDDGNFNSFGHGRSMGILFVALCGALSSLLVFKICRLYSDEYVSSLIAFSYGFASIAWVFSTIFYAQQVTAFFGVLALYMTLRSIKKGRASAWSMGVAGLALAASIMLDPISIILAIFLSAYLLFMFKKAALPIILAVLGVLAYGSYNYLNFGNPLVTSEEVYLAQGSGSLSGSFGTPLYFGLFGNLVSIHKGLLLYVPLAALGVLGLAYAPRRELLLLLGLIFSMLIPYSRWYEWGGGLSYGPRFLVPIIPYLIIPVMFLVNKYRSKVSFIVLFYILYVAGCVIAAIGAMQAVYGAMYFSNPSLEQIIDIRSNLFLRAAAEFLNYDVKSHFFLTAVHGKAAVFTVALITIISVCSIPIPILRKWILQTSKLNKLSH